MKYKTKHNDEPLMERSTRLRHTLEIARLCNFKYNAELPQNRYGGVFNAYQLEVICNVLRKFEIEILKLHLPIESGDPDVKKLRSKD